MKIKYNCAGCRSVVRDSSEDFDPGEYFAGVLARRGFGRRGHVGACCLDSWTEDGMCEEYSAFIGVSNGNGMSGHNVMFSVVKDVIK